MTSTFSHNFTFFVINFELLKQWNSYYFISHFTTEKFWKAYYNYIQYNIRCTNYPTEHIILHSILYPLIFLWLRVGFVCVVEIKVSHSPGTTWKIAIYFNFSRIFTFFRSPFFFALRFTIYLLYALPNQRKFSFLREVLHVTLRGKFVMIFSYVCFAYIEVIFFIWKNTRPNKRFAI